MAGAAGLERAYFSAFSCGKLTQITASQQDILIVSTKAFTLKGMLETAPTCFNCFNGTLVQCCRTVFVFFHSPVLLPCAYRPSRSLAIIPSWPSFMAAANRSRPWVKTVSDSTTAASESAYNRFEFTAPLDQRIFHDRLAVQEEQVEYDIDDRGRAAEKSYPICIPELNSALIIASDGLPCPIDTQKRLAHRPGITGLFSAAPCQGRSALHLDWPCGRRMLP